MPAKNVIKHFIENGYYHLYTRGVEKREIFKDKQDYIVFLSYIKQYLLKKDTLDLQNKLANPETPWTEKDRILRELRLNNFNGLLTLLAYCLMPNHLHFLVQQTDATVIDRFMQSLLTRYSMYFNKKYRRVGSLFQSVYKAVLVSSDDQLLHLTRYIHRNPSDIIFSRGTSLRSYEYASYPEYLGLRKTTWVKPDMVLSHFKSFGPNSYENFVEQSDDEQYVRMVKDATIDDE